MQNLFDQLDGHHEAQMHGLFSKLKKAVKKVGRKIDKARKKIGRKLDKSGFNKLAAGVGLAIVGGPAIVGAISKGGAAAKAAALGAKGIKIAGTASKTIAAVNAVKGATKSGAKVGRDQTMHNVYIAQQLGEAMGQSPKFKEAVERYRMQGYTDEQILQHWIESKSFYQNAVPAVQKAIMPQMVQQIQTQNPGIPPKLANDVALIESTETAENAVKGLQNEQTLKTLLPIGLIASLLLLR